jgi:rhodanese-related sulfurtransferase
MPLPPHPPERRTLLRFFGAALALAAANLHAQPAPATPEPDAVSIDTARAEVAAGRAILIDIREPHEHASGIAQGARLLPSSQLAARWSEIPKDGAPVYLVCATQNRSRAALRALRERGPYANVRYVSGGMSEWTRRGLPVVKP